MSTQCSLDKKKCIPCHGGITPLKGEALKPFVDELGKSWEVDNEHHLKKGYTFSDFVQALDFTNNVGKLAEEEGHHPDIHLSYGKVIITIWTHKIDGLSESDFILAAKIDLILTNDSSH